MIDKKIDREIYASSYIKGRQIDSREREHFLEIFKVQVDEIILNQLADKYLSIGWVPMA